MITNICLLLEVLSIIVCLHCLYGEKFKLDILTVSFLSIYMIIMAAINYYKLPSVISIIIYIFIGMYCGIKFEFKWGKLIVNTVLYLVIIGGMQLIVATCLHGFFNVLFTKNEVILLINLTVFLIILFILPKLRVDRLAVYLQDKERILVFSLFICIALTIASVVNYKVLNVVEAFRYVPLYVGISLVFILTGQLGKFKIRSKEAETELKMHQLYEDSFYSLIENIRLRQHEFDNHISTIYSLQYTCHTYEELINAQEEYSHAIIRENRHNKLLVAGNPLLIGFLYGKFIEIEKLGIEVQYKISIEDLDIGVPIYKIVEIVGNLIKNAVEALNILESLGGIYVGIREKNGEFEIEVRNKSKFIEYNEIESFFRKGFSKKGKYRGLGLYNVKRICDEYNLKIFCENRTINNENWICFSIRNDDVK